MKLLKILITLSLFISFKSQSQTKQDYIKELFVVMKQDSLMEQMGKKDAGKIRNRLSHRKTPRTRRESHRIHSRKERR